MITLDDKEQMAALQILLGVEADGVYGPQTESAWDALTKPKPEPGPLPPNGAKHDTYASSFADPADVEAFNKCKAAGHSDDYCFGFGDNGIGCWGDSTVEGTGPSCALPPETMKVKWGSKSAAKNKKVMVERFSTKARVECVLKDQMPSIKNLANKATIDLNPDACAAIGLEPPIMEHVVWWWLT